MKQEAFIHLDPLQEGIYTRYIRGDYIDHAAWMRACASNDYVGTCRWCGHELRPLNAEQTGNTWWYEAECTDCHKPCAAPGARIMQRSSRQSEQPAQWREGRDKRLKDQGRGAA